MKKLLGVFLIVITIVLLFSFNKVSAYSLVIYYSDITFESISKDMQVFLLIETSTIDRVESYKSSPRKYKKAFRRICK